MRRIKIYRSLATAMVVALFVIFAGVGHATTIVAEGFDLFQTEPGTAFDFNTVPNPQVVNFEGVELGCFDFGAGCVFTGTTDTIVLRLSDADLGGGSDTIDIELVALSLVSVSPVDLGFGAGFEDLFITLNTSFLSTMTIFDTGEGTPHGTFDSTLNFSFDVTGSVGGFYATIAQIFNSSGTAWSHEHGPDAMLIDGINHNLNGADHSEDFQLGIGEVLHTGPHPVVSAITPEPGTALLLGMGLAGLAAHQRRKR